MKSQDCYPPSGCGSWTTTWMGVVYHKTGYPEFETCTLTVAIKTRVCGNRTQVWCSGIYFYDPFSDCTALINWLFPDGWGQGQSPNPDRAQDVFDYVYENIMEQLFIRTTQNMKSSFLCNNNSWKEYIYYKSQCKTICFALMTNSPNPDPNFQFFYINTQNCSDICCQVIIKFCWPSAGASEPNMTRMVITSPDQPNCETTPAPSCNYPPGTIIWQGQSDCFSIPCQ